MEGDIIYTEKDDIDGFYLLTKGIASFNLVKRSNMICGVIESKTDRNPLPTMSVDSFEYFGLEDTVLSHIKLHKEHSANNQKFLAKGEALLSQRMFHVSSLKDSEALFLDVQTLDKMKRDFYTYSKAFYQTMINHFFVVYQQNRFCSFKFR
jgi:hypothetical protein